MEPSIEKVPISMEEQPYRNRLERHWFWIALLPMATLFLQLGTVTANVTSTIEVGNELIMGPGFALVIIGLLFAPYILKRTGVLGVYSRFRLFCTISAGVGSVAFIGFFLCVALMENPPVALCIALIYISLLALGSLTGCTLHRAIKIITVKQAGIFSGIMVIAFVGVFVLASIFQVVFNYWTVFYITESLLYAAPMAALLILLFRTNSADSDAYTAPKTSVYFNDALYKKFMLAAFLILLAEMFHDGSYYGGGTYTNIFDLWGQVLILIIPVVTGITVTLLIRKNRWFPAILAVAVLFCFEQGLILFFNNDAQLAIAYAVSSNLISSCPLILALFIPAVYCAQRRKSATAMTGAISFWISGTVLNTLMLFISFLLGDPVSLVMFVRPAVTFVISLALIVYLFYLYSENNRVYITGLIEGFKRRDITEITETVSSADRFEGLRLAPREKEVCSLLLKSLTLRQIAGELGISYDTVNGYYKSLYRKLGINSKGELFMRFGAEPKPEPYVSPPQ